MSRTEEISTEVKAVTAAVGEARSHAEETLEFSREQAEVAAAHGWGGVVQSLTMASDPLESVAEQLMTAEQSCESAYTMLDLIYEQMNRSDVVEHLVRALAELDAAGATVEGAIALVDEGGQGAEQAGHESLSAQLQNLRTEVEQLLTRLDQSRTDADAERQEAENLGQQAQTGPRTGN